MTEEEQPLPAGADHNQEPKMFDRSKPYLANIISFCDVQRNRFTNNQTMEISPDSYLPAGRAPREMKTYANRNMANAMSTSQWFSSMMDCSTRSNTGNPANNAASNRGR